MKFLTQIYGIQAEGEGSKPPAAPNSVYHHIHVTIPAYMLLNLKCCKQSCERADLASLKRSCGKGERIKLSS